MGGLNMARDIEQMSDHELLMELISDKRRQDKIRYIKYAVIGIFVAAVVIELVIWVPKIVAMVNYYNGIISQIDTTVVKINNVVSDIPDGLVQKINDLIESLNSVFSIFNP